jgi:hypothetical protein
LAQVVQLVVRVVATQTEIDARLGRAADQLSAAQTDNQRLKSKNALLDRPRPSHRGPCHRRGFAVS